MRQLYVCSKAIPCVTALPESHNNRLCSRLIGILREIKPGVSPEQNGEYEFKYTIGGEFKEDCLMLHKLTDPQKIYNNDEIYHLLKIWLPVPNSRWFNKNLETAGLTEHNEWEWLKHFGAPNHVHEPWLYEVLPEDVMRYE
ncbi:hypothetical protein FACS1894188_06700 [Clostridia bacterium]|nr:hypothetical protein FACS1894188_06700 [Clostridia bacterium]